MWYISYRNLPTYSSTTLGPFGTLGEAEAEVAKVLVNPPKDMAYPNDTDKILVWSKPSRDDENE